MAFILPRRQTAQPPQQASRINWDSPLSKGLQHVYSAASGNGFINIGGISNQIYKGATFQAAQGGALADRYGDSTGQATRQKTTAPAPTDGWTIASIITITSTPIGKVSLVGHNDLGAFSHDRAILVDPTNGFGGYLYDGSEKIAWSFTPATLNQTYKVIVWYDPTLSTVNLAVDRLTNSFSTASTSSGYSGYGTNVYFGVGDVGFPQTAPQNYVSLALKATLMWTPQMRQAFFNNPWQIFAPTSALRVATSTPVSSGRRIFIPKRVIAQPQQATRINRNNPLTKGLEVALTPNATPLTDAFGAKYAQIQTLNGPAIAYLKTVGNSTAFVLPQTITSNQWTIVQEVSNTPEAGIYSSSGGIYNGSVTDQRIHVHYKAYPSNNFGADARPYYADFNSSQALPSSGGRSILAVTVSSANNLIASYVNGVPATAGTSALLGSGNISVDRIELFRKQFGGGGQDPMADGTTGSLFYVWSRALSASEIAAVSSNPWQIYTAPPLALLSSSTPPVVTSNMVGEYISRGVWRGIFRGVV